LLGIRGTGGDLSAWYGTDSRTGKPFSTWDLLSLFGNYEPIPASQADLRGKKLSGPPFIVLKIEPVISQVIGFPSRVSHQGKEVLPA